MKHAPTAKLGQLINDILKPIQNSGTRTESIQKIVEDIQKSTQRDPLGDDEVFVSFDIVKFYENLDINLFLHSVRVQWDYLREHTGRRLDWKAFQKCVQLCYDEPFIFENKLWSPTNGSQTGHPLSSLSLIHI